MLPSFNCIIIEDELPASRLLEMHIAKHPSLSLKGSFVSTLHALSTLKREKIDLVFLDINLPGKSGVDFAKTLVGNTSVIFTTAYAEHAVHGFDLDAIDYILKPISFERFSKAIDKFYKTRNLVPAAETVPVLPVEKPFIFVKCERKMMKLFLEEIHYVESQGNYLLIYTDKGYFKTYQSITEMEEKLPENTFCRIHRSFLVSISKIKAFNSNSVTVQNKQLSIGRLYSASTSKLLQSLILVS
ncbi:DNA-binding response regulator [Solitalea longa]|uniref:DNA-binding response regulator n=1 Tax=Solitalea longa TaxID=2079460 RepID=A0A2S5A3M6_9SPHI|nr:LytTR family DNA-binding domain-containing protein [Solitalea longa]POY37178.1 DNA-binding response regulator [Solitalea longa]